GLLLKLAPGSDERIFIVLEETLGNRPGGVILARPERAAGVHQEQLEAARLSAIHEKAGAQLWHRCPVSTWHGQFHLVNGRAPGSFRPLALTRRFPADRFFSSR